LKIGTETITGQEVEIDVNARTGQFTISKGENTLGRGDTLEKALASARSALAKAKVKVAVPFALEDGRRGVADSRHLRNRTILCTIDGQRDEIATFRGSGVLSPDIPDEKLTRLGELADEIRERTLEAEAITKEYPLDIGRAVDEAVAEKQAERAAKGVPA
jgi:hypothetical protein